jgi:glycosyltransferase involved in cell wall biosynthesis
LRQAWASVESQTVPAEHLVSIDEEHEGPAAVRNWLASQADAEWLLPLDDDDLLDGDCIEELLEHSLNADVIYPWCRVEDHEPSLEPWCPNRLFNADALMRFNYIPVTALVRRELWLEVGGMPQAPHSEDWLFWRRCLGAGAVFKCVDEVLWTYRRGIAGSRNLWVVP